MLHGDDPLLDLPLGRQEHPAVVLEQPVRQRRGGPWNWARDLRGQAGSDDHARFADDLVDSGFIVLGGPLQGEREVLIIVSAPDEDAVRQRFADDP